MRKLGVFMSVSLDGYFADVDGDMSWAHTDDPQFNAFVAGNASGGGELLMGRITYELMASYWPTSHAMENDPIVAKAMNDLPKVVFSRTLKEASWHNTRLAADELGQEIRRMKQSAGPDLVVLGSGSIAGQLAEQGLVDEFRLVVVPLALGAGRSMFEGITRRLPLSLTGTRSFHNGNVLLTYVAK
jgi:dihydrofolate reductase